jgi:hypothetical protein
MSLLTFLLVPLLPERVQERWPWPLPASLGVMAHASAYLNTIAAAVAWAVTFVVYQKAYAERLTEIIANETGDASYITWYGTVTYFSFLFTPAGILLTLYLLDSGARLTHALANGGPMGSLFFCLPVWLGEKATEGWRRREMTARYGRPDAPDRIREIGDGLLLCSNRPHETWHALLTFSYGGRLYQLTSHGEGIEDGHPCFEYRLRPWPDQQMVRALVILDHGQGSTSEAGNKI